MLDGVELAEDHAVFDALGQQADNLLELVDGLIQYIASGRGGGCAVLALAEPAKVNAPQ